MRPSHLKEALLFHARNREPAGVVGAPGVGKSEIIASVAKEIGLPVMIMNLVLSDPTDLKGLPFALTLPDGTRVTEWVKQKQLLTKKPFCLFLDELFQAPTATMNVAAPIVLENRIDDIFLPQGSWVVFASNRAEDKAGVNRVPSHIPNRCTIYNGPDASIDDWADWALRQKDEKAIEMGVIQYLRMKPNALHDFDPMRLINATPRQWAWVGRNVRRMPEAIMFETVGGRVGEAFAAELKAFLRIQDQLPTKEQILAQPKKTKVPDEASALYLVTGMLAQAANKETFDAICTYAERMPPEFQAMLVKDAMRLKPEVTNTKAFVGWGVKFAEVLR